MQVEEEESDGERGDGMKLCFLRAHTERGHDVARRQDRARYTTRAKVGIRNKKKGKGERRKKKESGGREAGEGPRVRSLFRSFINPPP